MICCNLARRMGEHKLRIIDVARKTGLNCATVTLRYETTQKVSLDIIEKICLLFGCGIVGNLLKIQDQ